MWRFSIYSICVLIICVLTPSWVATAQAATHPEITSADPQFALGPISRIATSPKDADQPPKTGWQPIDTSTINLGISRQATWVVSEFTATEDAYQYRNVWFYNLNSGNIGNIRFRHYINGELVAEETSGSHSTFAERSIAYRVFTFRVDMSPGAHRIEVKLDHDAHISITPELVSPFAWFLDISADQLFLGSMLGIVAFLALYNLGVFVVVRETVFLSFFVTFAAALTFRVVDAGLGSHYLFPDHPHWHTLLLRIAGGAYIAGLLLFTADYLRVGHWAATLRRFMLAHAVLIVLLVFVPQQANVAALVVPLIALGPVVCAAVSIYALYKRVPGSQSFFVAAVIFTTGVSVSIAMVAGVLPQNLLTEHAGDMAVLALGIITSLGLASRLSEEKADKQQAELVAASKSQFLANMSHEIRTPLNAIVGFSDLLRDMKLGDQPRDFVDRIDRASKNLLGIINDVLDFSKIDAHKLHLEQQPVSLTELVDNMRDLFGTKAQQKHLDLTFQLDADVPDFVSGDEIRLTQILTNLISNAIKFTERGSVSVRISRVPVNLLQIQVQDSGIGLSEAAQQQLFQPFTQADASTTRKYGGTGLGLAISHQLSQLMGGDLTVHSHQGKGATFTCTVPIIEVAQPPTRASQNPTSQLQDVRVLVVEDNQTNQMLTRAMLTKCGAQCVIAENGQEAVKLLDGSQDHFDIVLMDCQMPILDGFAATEVIRQKLKLKDLPIIAMTANALSGDKEACLQSGMNDYLAKPVRINDIALMVSKWTATQALPSSLD